MPKRKSLGKKDRSNPFESTAVAATANNITTNALEDSSIAVTLLVLDTLKLWTTTSIYSFFFFV